MSCPECKSQHIHKNGFHQQKQNYRFVDCGRQFIENPQPHLKFWDVPVPTRSLF